MVGAMETLIQNLKRRQVCIKSIIHLDETFLIDLKKNGSDSSRLREYNNKREGAFRVLSSLEVWVQKAVDTGLVLTNEHIRRLILNEQELFKLALQSGNDILLFIEKDKSDVVYNIRNLNHGRTVISAYRSGEERIENIERNSSVNKEA